MMGPFRAVVGWWRRRSLRLRITIAVSVCSLAILLGLAKAGAGLIGVLQIDSVDATLRPALDGATARVSAGAATLTPSTDVQRRVLDTAGDPLDGQPKPVLDAHELDALKSGGAVLRTGDDPPHRWLGAVVTAPDGSQRLVLAGAALVGYWPARSLGGQWLLIAAAVGAAAVGMITWFAVRTSLRPVRKLRQAAQDLPVGQRLPRPVAADELRALADALNSLLARRDEATARLQRFTGDAAHELRSPVASIRAQAEVAVLHPDPRASLEVLADITGEAERLSTLINSLLVLARSDAGELPKVTSVDLAFAVQAAIDRLPDDAPQVRFEQPAGQCRVLADVGEVALVLDNLLRNAARYARARITVLVLPAGNSVRLLVDDDGPGIPVEHRPKVFDRFYRIEDDRARESGGSGLGLALVATLVRRRGGTVRVAESPEGGARFDLRWPAASG